MSLSATKAGRAGGMTFRSDINGLRAIAVMAVVLFHFDVKGFSGGFVGVDIFFVISGYLMTKIIFDRIDQKRFSIAGFLFDRARRIMPALLLLCAVLMGLGWLILIPNELLVLGKHSTSSVLFFSNFVFWNEAGYFDLASREKWLLHTWSLSVEFQFYLVYPFLAALLARFTPRRISIAILALIGLLSLAVCVYQTSVTPSAAFFLLPARAWELLAGALVYFWAFPLSERARQGSEALGLLLIIIAIFAFSPEAPWPGWRATIPVTGTALVILAGRPGRLWATNAVTAWLGRTSYSIYLWHWPVVVALNYEGFAGRPIGIAAGIALSLLLGSISYRFVEGPTQRWLGRSDVGAGLGRNAVVATLCAAALLVAGAGFGLWIDRGVPTRFSPAVALADAAAREFNTLDTACFVRSGPPAAPCIIGKDKTTVAVEMVGDSHASSTVTALAAAIPPTLAGGVRYEAYASCPTLLHGVAASPENHCYEFNQKYVLPIVNGPPSNTPIVVVNNWRTYADAGALRFVPEGAAPEVGTTPFSMDAYADDLVGTLCAIEKKRPTYVTLPFPDYPDRIPQTLARELTYNPNAPDITMPIADYSQRQALMTSILKRAADCGVRLLNPAPFLCPNGVCLGSLHGHPLYFDNHHLNEYGNKFLVPMFAEIFQGAASLSVGSAQ